MGIHDKKKHAVVITDVLRATTTAIAAFEHGVQAIIPVADLDEARSYKERGYLVAAERNGHILDFADLGNSAFDFMVPEVVGKTIVHTTTNGTYAIRLAENSEHVVLGAFVNLHALLSYLIGLKEDVLVLCSGWMNDFCLEDTLFAGALATELIQGHKFKPKGDSVQAAIHLWELAKNDLLAFLKEATHLKRLQNLGIADVFEYTFTIDGCKSVPVLKNNVLVNAFEVLPDCPIT
jgi:2-phosphosulfolactate phosphatase